MVNTRKRALVIGGGIGGLSAALVLRQAGMDVQVFEAAQEMRALGAGITLGDLHALDARFAATFGNATVREEWLGKVLDPLIPRPDILGADLSQIVDLIVNAEKGYMQ